MSCNNSTEPVANLNLTECLPKNDTNPFSTVVAEQRRTSFEERIFQYCVIVIGIIGTFANGTVITVFVSQSRKIKITTPHKFILNQLALDFLSCICLVLVYGWKIIDIDFKLTWNFLSCVLVASETLIWATVSASMANLTLITFERYAKIVHTPLYKKYYHSWMTYFLILVSWIAGALITFPPDLVSVDYSNGICEYYSKWPNPYDGLVFSSALFCMNYAIPMLIFIFCYLRILLVMRNSASFFAKDSSASNISSAHQKSQVAIIKTIIIITVLFGVCWSPNNFLLVLIASNIPSLNGLDMNSSAWYATLFWGFLTVCIHPFIYGARVDIVKNCMKNLFVAETNANTYPLSVKFNQARF